MGIWKGNRKNGPKRGEELAQFIRVKVVTGAQRRGKFTERIK